MEASSLCFRPPPHPHPPALGAVWGKDGCPLKCLHFTETKIKALRGAPEPDDPSPPLPHPPSQQEHKSRAFEAGTILLNFLPEWHRV